MVTISCILTKFVLLATNTKVRVTWEKRSILTRNKSQIITNILRTSLTGPISQRRTN